MGTPLLDSKISTFLFLLNLVFLTVCTNAQRATNSVFVNFGRQLCSQDGYIGSDITLFANAQNTTPDLLLQCNTDDPIGNIFSKFISYNATNNKLYINDYSDYENSQIYILNVGIPNNVTCPIISLSYTIPDVILSQFEFDPFGDLYALSDYDPYTGTANIGAYDDTTGLLQPGSLKTLVFPAGHFPNDLNNGDLAIIPNGRMFCIFGNDTSQLFEITNYQKTITGSAQATFIGVTSKVCYGLAFNNGYLIMGGTNLDGDCYSFNYNLATQVLSEETASPLNSMPIDNTSFSPGIGTGEKLITAVQADATHYDLTYQIYIKNMGNSKVGSIQLKENLSSVFGAANISNISTAFISNGAGLALNPSFNGSTDITLLATGHTINNYPTNKNTSIIELKVTVADPIPLFVYNVSAIFTGKIGKDSTLLNLKDSSNNYSNSFSSWTDVIDPNRNNVADDPGEGIPTPWSMGIEMPISLSTFDVAAQSEGALLNWSTLSEDGNSYFAIERSNDAVTFDSIGVITGAGTSTVEHKYSFIDPMLLKGTTYYRLKEMNTGGGHTYSETRVLESPTLVEEPAPNYMIYPNPASDHLVFESSDVSSTDLNLEIHSLCGSSVFNKLIPGSNLREQIPLPQLPNGFYIITIKNSAHAPQYFEVSISNK